MANVANSTWTPTLLGGSVAGATTYQTQIGHYSRIGNLIIASCILQVLTATGTGDVHIGGLPLPIGQYCSCATQWGGNGWTWPAGCTSLSLEGAPGESFVIAKVSGTGQNAANMQMANATLTVIFTLSYLAT